MRTIFKFFLIITFLISLFYLYQNYQKFFLIKIKEDVIDYQIKNLSQDIFSPPPVLNIKNDTNYILTNNGIFNWTNFYRKENNLLELKSNNILDKIATLRAKDMFEKNYFSHYSESGIGAGEIAKEVGYEYISIGENIALGNFKDDKALVDAWMASPGHRSNILSSKYNEIGIAVMKEDFYDKEKNEFQKVWIAVQIFGKPIGDCQKPDENLRKEIESLEQEINALKLKIENLYQELISKTNNFKKENISNYNNIVILYNNLVQDYNEQFARYKSLVGKYNLQVEMFNQCINL